jgi:hypothetical protein
MSPSLVPSTDHDLHFVLCDFGRYGRSYIETDPREADRDTIVRNMIDGQYDRPLRVIALNPAEGWSRDVSEEIAKAVLTVAEADDRVLTAGTSAFVQAHPRKASPTFSGFKEITAKPARGRWLPRAGVIACAAAAAGAKSRIRAIKKEIPASPRPAAPRIMDNPIVHCAASGSA